MNDRLAAMLRRYVLPCLLILLLSAGAGSVAYVGQTKTVFLSACEFQAFIRISREDPSTPEHQQFIGTIALQQVGAALASGLYSRVGESEKVPSATIASETTILPAPGLGAFTLTMTDPSSERSTRLANAACDEYVRSIKKQRAAQIDAQVKVVQDRIDSIQAEVVRLSAIPFKKLTNDQKAALQAKKGALVFNYSLIANLNSFPPDAVSVVIRAVSAQKKQTGNLSKKLIIAGVSGLLACFLYILVGEILAERRRASLAQGSP